MKLKEWLKTAAGGYPLSATEFAKKIQVSTMKVYTIINHEEVDMRLSIALRIEKETKGKVKPGDLLPEHVWKESKRKK